MKKLLLSLLLTLAPALAAAPNVVEAVPLERDLGHGLAYFRVHTLPADLPVATARRGAAILDLRYTRDESGATIALGEWLKAHCSTATPVFVLLNTDTAPAVLAYFTSHNPIAGLVTLGGAAPGYTPDIVLKIHPAAERAAYDALAHGTSVETLLADPLNKTRHDEASIAQERSAPAEDPTDSDSDIANPGEAAPIAPAPPAPVIDYALRRAVHLHRALLALRKL